MDLKDLTSLYRRWFWLLIGGLILGLASGFLASKIQTPIYEASAKVLVAKSRPQSGNDILAISDQQLVTTYLQLLKTRPVLAEVESRLNADIQSENIVVDIIPNTQIIQINVQDQNPKQAFAIANTLIDILIEQNETLYTGRYTTYEEGLNSQITLVEEQINTLQGQITQLNQATVEEQLKLVNQQIADLQVEISSLEKEIAGFPSVLSTVARASLAEKQTQLDQLRSLLYLYQQIQTNLTFIGKPGQGGTGPDDVRITGLQSTLNLYQELYLSLLNNLTAVRLSRIQSTPTVSQIDNAVIPERPVRPIPLLYSALSGIVGLLIAAGAILLIDYFDESLKSAQKVKEILGTPVIGEISDMGAIHHNFGRTYSANTIDSSLLNAFGILRINISRLLAQNSVKSILVTSSAPDDGKSTVAAYLAMAFAQSGKRVALLDADLTNPALHSSFGLDNQRGLSNGLTENLNWKDIARDVNGITVITSGAPSESSAVLFESDYMTDFLEKLQTEADVVIIDGPPLSSVDSQILASKVGGTLFVVRQGATATSVARSMLEQLRLMGANVFGTVLNRTPRTSAYNFHKYPRSIFARKTVKRVEQVEASHS